MHVLKQRVIILYDINNGLDIRYKKLSFWLYIKDLIFLIILVDSLDARYVYKVFPKLITR